MSYAQPQPSQVAPKSPALAALASFFIPGLGSLIIGRVSWGIAIFAAWVLSWFLIALIVGFFLLPLVWIWGILDAYLGAKTWNTQHGIVS